MQIFDKLTSSTNAATASKPPTRHVIVPPPQMTWTMFSPIKLHLVCNCAHQQGPHLVPPHSPRSLLATPATAAAGFSVRLAAKGSRDAAWLGC